MGAKGTYRFFGWVIVGLLLIATVGLIYFFVYKKKKDKYGDTDTEDFCKFVVPSYECCLYEGQQKDDCIRDGMVRCLQDAPQEIVQCSKKYLSQKVQTYEDACSKLSNVICCYAGDQQKCVKDSMSECLKNMTPQTFLCVKDS